MSFLLEVTRTGVNCQLNVVTCNARLRTPTSRTGVRILRRTSKNSIFQDFRYERSGNDQKQNDGELNRSYKECFYRKILTKSTIEIVENKSESVYRIIASFYNV